MRFVIVISVLLCLALPVCAQPVYQLLVPQPPVAVQVQVAPLVRVPCWRWRHRPILGGWVVRRGWYAGVVLPAKRRARE